jgi:hypothetical protein
MAALNIKLIPLPKVSKVKFTKLTWQNEEVETINQHLQKILNVTSTDIKYQMQ